MHHLNVLALHSSSDNGLTLRKQASVYLVLVENSFNIRNILLQRRSESEVTGKNATKIVSDAVSDVILNKRSICIISFSVYHDQV